jgi:ribosomal protein L21E
MIAKFMTAKDTTKYIDELDRLINIYNNTSHSSLDGLKPIDVEKNEENIITVGNINQEKREHNQVLDKKIKIKKGDLVRIKLKRTIFSKGYEVRYSNEVYTVEEVKGDAVLLNDERTIQIKNVMIVPNDAENIPKGKKRKIDKVIKHIQRLAREGLI